jgi:probable rRNA maturation factor
VQRIEVVNRQRKIKIIQNEWNDFVFRVVQSIAESKNKSVAVAFVSDRKMRELNRTFRGKDATTDVLSFPYEADDFEFGAEFSDSDENYLGDIAISLEQAQRQAFENDLNLETEIKQLVLHGVLHLCGYDHETDSGEMNELELKYRRELKIN